MEYRRIIPNSISGTNLILGVLSIFESVAGNFEWAAIYIILAVAVDACDGRAARALGVAGSSASRWILFATFVRSALRLP